MSVLFISAIFTIALSFLLTGLFRHFAIRRHLLDVPNHRSSHVDPTPRGGGIAIVVTFLAALGVICLTGRLEVSGFLGIAGAACLVAMVGFIDDLGHVAVRWRLFGQVLAGMWALVWFGVPPLEIGGLELHLGWSGGFFFLVYIVWMLNLYNFMDGIDGIAAIQAICTCVGACVLYYAVDLQTLAYPVGALAAATVGFLIWNFPPAKIFMGDSGSGFLGIVLASLSIQAAHFDARLFAAWLVLLGIFIVDATFTLMRRLIRGDKVYQAHRSHAYQRAARRYGGHLPVTFAVALINIGWLLPIAWAIVAMKLNTALALSFAYAPLVALAIWMGAGSSEQNVMRDT